MLQELMEKHALDDEDIKLLFTRSDQYIVPYLQTHVKRCGLVLYNTNNRENAIEEANEMESSLITSGFQTKKIEWENACGLPSMINEQLEELVAHGVSLLVVSIMSHGTAGMLRVHNDTKISISNILKTLKMKLPEHIPLVIF